MIPMPTPDRMIREIAEKDKIAFKKHSAIRMRERKIRADDVKQILINGEIIEDYPNDRPLPSYLILGFAENQKPIHAVVAIDVNEQIIWVITVYSPSLREWEDGYKRRKTI